MSSVITLDEAVGDARTGDLWLFRGPSPADRLIRWATRAPVNHVGMAVVIEGRPPMLWHADAGHLLPDLWSGTLRAGAQLHDLRGAVVAWARRYGQRPWLRPLEHPVDPEAQLAVLETIDTLDGAPYPSPTQQALGWLRARGRRAPSATERPGDGAAAPSGTTTVDAAPVDCAQVVALAYEAMGLLPEGRRPAWYDPGRFWSGRGLELRPGARLREAVAVLVPPRDVQLAHAL